MRLISNVVGLVFTSFIAAATGCGSSGSKSSSGSDCATGSERCSCYGNLSCDSGLTCLSDVCVQTTGSGGASSLLTGGASGNGGNSAAVNSNAIGGTNNSGDTSTAGGTTATGGSTGTGATTSASTNLIKNGDFSLGKTYWDLTWQAGEYASYSYSAGAYCITNDSSSYYLSFSLGYPPTPTDAFTLEPGTYTLSFLAQGYASLITKLGLAVTPYTSVVQFNDSVGSASYQVFTHTITVTSTQAQVGLVFNGTLDYSQTVCFDDVTIVKQ